MLLGLVALILVVTLAVLPQIWVRSVLAFYAKDRPDLPGTGGELARHLLNEMKLNHVKVEQTQEGDHYDPINKVVRLSQENFGGRSITAVAVAAHEVGHAMQDATNYAPLKRRTVLAKQAVWIERIGSLIILVAPAGAALLKHPAGMLLEFIAGLAILSISVVIHVSTLPVEFDASFNRALPVLKHGKYLTDKDMPAARRILQAAAFTYVAAALMSLVNVTRWLRILRI